ncbi:hypothetical protein Scep_019417 [Stephania cephalantha]|uniref:Reverse transcriptase domain-containing protein n=1 Tax=Stephania cephalantha TaxID=152367 RepID=A0AAP0IAS1_9MAGN
MAFVDEMRELRQGDPLSPFLIILVADVMGRIFEIAKLNNMIEGFKVGREGVHITHLQYADDSLLFVKNTKESATKAMQLVRVFCMISGLKLNMDKCSLLGINVPDEEVLQVAEGIECQVGAWPMKYLRMPIGGSPMDTDF